MAKIDFYTIDREEKEAIFNAIATEKGMNPFAVEKDWWVSRTLEIIFQMPIAKHLVFKGGTSLSKAWKLINRFSEDIDLAIDSADSEYILPRVQLEISCRSLREPFTVQSFGSLVDEFYSGKEFVEPLFEVPTVNAERTFLEKVFLLHEEFHRPADKMRVDRLSRHLYDIYHLTKAGVAERAISDKKLYETIVAHRYKFSRVGGVNYNLLNPKTLNPIPPTAVIADWESDYAKMREDMIYEEVKPSFEDLIDNLIDLKTKLQALDWQFELTFPIPNS